MKCDIASVVATRRATFVIPIPALKRRAKLISTLRVEKRRIFTDECSTKPRPELNTLTQH